MTSLLLALVLSRGRVPTVDVLANVRNAIHVASSEQPWPATQVTGRAFFSGVDCQYSLQFSPDGPFCQTIKGSLGQVFGYDGTTYWQIDRTGASRLLSFDDVDRTQALMLLLTDRWLDPNTHVNATAEPHKAGDPTYKIHFKPRDTGLYETVTIDPETWLPKLAEYQIASSKTIVTLSDWRAAGSLKLPFAITVTNEGLTDTIFADSATSFTGPKSTYSLPDSAPTDFAFDPSIASAVETKRAVTGHVLVHPRVNGKDIGWFILDSGADSMVIDSSVADTLNLSKVGMEAVMGVGGSVQEPFRKADTLTLGPATMKGVTFVEVDLHQLSDIFKVKLSGIVGFDFFRRFIVEVNLSKPSVTVDNAADFHLQGGSWSKMLFSSGNPAVEATFEGGRKAWFRIDTGANGAVTFHAPTVERLHLLEGRNTTPANMAGVGGVTEARYGKLAWFELGGHRFEKIDVTFSLAKSGAFADGYLAGNIGQDLMEPFTVVFDFGGSRVAFLPH